jgi:hypothetical protein
MMSMSIIRHGCAPFKLSKQPDALEQVYQCIIIVPPVKYLADVLDNENDLQLVCLAIIL